MRFVKWFRRFRWRLSVWWKKELPDHYFVQPHCPGCGRKFQEYFDAAGRESEHFEIIDSRKGFSMDWGTTYDWTIKATCPACDTEFTFTDGSP